MTRLLIVDDSATMRRIMQAVFTDVFDEVAFARTGEEALSMLPAFRPDVVTLDLIMPGMDGLDCLRQIMETSPVPVVVSSMLTTDGSREAVEALALGAVDVITKPFGATSPGQEAFVSEVVRKVRAAATSRRHVSGPSRTRHPSRTEASFAAGSFPVVLLASSTGGPQALDAVLTALPSSFPAAIVICQHMPANFTGSLARRLDRRCALVVREVDREMPLRPGHVFIARGDADVELDLSRDGVVARSVAPHPEHRWHPSAERLVESAMKILEPGRLIGVLLTGMGSDGASAMTTLQALGGRTLAEAAGTATVWGMPRALIERGGADQVVDLDAIAATLLDLVHQRNAS